MLLLLKRITAFCLLLFCSGAFFPASGQNAPDPIQDFVGEWDLPGTPTSITISRKHIVLHTRWGRGDMKWDNADYFVISYRDRAMTCHYIVRLYSQDQLSFIRAEQMDPPECDLGELRRAPGSQGRSDLGGGREERPSGDVPSGKTVSAIDNAAKAPKPGDVIRDCEECPEVAVLPGGAFAMGSPDDEAGRRSEEGPVHTVRIKQVAIGRYAVTRRQYQVFVTETGYNEGKSCRVNFRGKFEDRAGYSFLNPGFPQDDTHPVVCVNWYDALAYVSWLSKKTGKSYRLPSEAEREYAARAKTTTPYSFEASISSAVANYDPNVTPVPAVVKGTLPVATFKANGFGLYQMHGNVAEWTQDCWNTSYDNSPGDGAAVSSGNCAKRVVRGGAWGYGAADIRSAYREAAIASDHYFHVGFRVARDLGQ
jgi:formylglycine-generating enzyme required for sulfatase activity